MAEYTEKETEEIFNNICKDYKIYAPVKQDGAGRLSNTDLYTYGYVNSLSEIVFDEKTYFSPKSVLFPTRETMYISEGGELTEATEELEPTILFIRSCDVHALKVLDTMFLKNGNAEDPYYRRRRENIKIFLLECPEAFENCFCVSMKTNETNEYSAFLEKSKDGYSAKINDETFKKYFNKDSKKDLQPLFSQKDWNPVNIPKKIDDSIFKHSMWDEYSARCIACGRCNTSCPTCTCFSVQSIPDQNDPSIIHRKRIWSSCQVEDFSRLAGDHCFRTPIGERMRYKVLHKIHDFEKRNGFQMCIGCGRCDDVCPEYISMGNSINKINDIMQMKENTEAGEITAAEAL